MLRTSILLALLFGTATFVSAEELSEGEIKARDFSYKSATFGMTLSEFERDFKVGLPTEANPATQTVTHRLVVSQGRMMHMEFHRERLSTITVFLTPQEVARVGGEHAVEKKIVGMFGRPPIITNGVYLWVFPNVERTVGYTENDGTVAIQVEDTSAQDATDTQVSVEFEF